VKDKEKKEKKKKEKERSKEKEEKKEEEKVSVVVSSLMAYMSIKRHQYPLPQRSMLCVNHHHSSAYSHVPNAVPH